MAKATPRPGRRANATAASGVAASPSTSISTKKRSAAVIPCAETLMSRPVMTTFERIAELPLTIDGYALEGRERRISAGVRAPHHHLPPAGRAARRASGRTSPTAPRTSAPSRRAAPTCRWPARGRSRRSASTSAGSTSSRRGEPGMPAFRFYRRWAIESAALDLALRQAGRSLAQALGREESPIHFVASLRIGSPPSFEPVGRRLEVYPWLQFKLDGTPDWDQDLIDRLAATGAVASIDFKGAYKGTPVDVDTDPAFYRRIAETLPDAWLEDPDLTDPEADAVLEPYRHRITWDAPIHSVADIEQPRVRAAHDQRQAVAVRLDEGALRRLRLLRRARDRDLRRRPVRARRRARADPVSGLALPSRRRQRHRARGLRLGRVPDRPARRARSLPTTSPPAFAGGRRIISDAAQAAPGQDGEQVRARGDAEARDALGRGARGRDALPRRRPGDPRRARGRADGRQALARALPRRDRRRAAPGAPAAAADGGGVAGARRAASRGPQGGGREARSDPAHQPAAAGPALHGPGRPAAGRPAVAAGARDPADPPARRSCCSRSAGRSSRSSRCRSAASAPASGSSGASCSSASRSACCSSSDGAGRRRRALARPRSAPQAVAGRRG